MAKKAAVAQKPATPAKPDRTQVLVDAIVTVRHLQGFIQQHGGLDGALTAVTRVDELVKLTGSFDSLKTALGIVGQEQPSQA